MTQFSMFPWETQTATGDGAAPYTQQQANEFFRYFDVQEPASEGVAKGVLGELAVSGSSSPLSVAAGAAICYGRYWNDAPVQLTVSTPSVGTTGGRVVLRADWSANTIRLAVKVNTDGVGTIPALTQTANSIWEISLATFTITTGGVITLTDDRTFRRSTFVVGANEILDLAVVTGKLAAAAVTTAKLADNAVDDTKAGNRVPQFYRRQGGNASNWSTPGDTTYTPGAVRMQAGSAQLTYSGSASASVAITFPVPFSSAPLIFCQTSVSQTHIADVRAVSANGFTLDLYTSMGDEIFGSFTAFWLAIGPE